MVEQPTGTVTFLFTDIEGSTRLWQEHPAEMQAAKNAQEALADASWPGGAEIRVRMGVHTGEAQERDGDYFGPALNRAARIMSADGSTTTAASPIYSCPLHLTPTPKVISNDPAAISLPSAGRPARPHRSRSRLPTATFATRSASSRPTPSTR